MNAITTTTVTNESVLTPSSKDGTPVNKDRANRLAQFITYLNETGGHWYAPNLEAYGYHLLARGMAVTSVNSHLSTIRGQYARIIDDMALRDLMFSSLPQDASFADRKAMVDEFMLRVQKASKPPKQKTEDFKAVVNQDVSDKTHLRLTIAQRNALLQAPGMMADRGELSRLRALRDTAIIALLAGTGIREMELAEVTVKDLTDKVDGVLGLRVRIGKGKKSRFVPYGVNDWCLTVVNRWLARAGITEGYVFRGLAPYTDIVQASPLTTRAIQKVLKAYPIAIDGGLRSVKPHDLRRTYARLAYDSGQDLLKIQQNLGHASLKTTQGYIGQIDMSLRAPANMPPPDINNLLASID